MIRQLAAAALLIAGFQPAVAEPTTVHAVRLAMDSAGLKGSRIGILYGQPMVSGELQGIGTVAALRRCSSGDPARRFCEEVAFKTCIQLAPTADRLGMLEAANTYNLESYTGTMVLDTNDLLGNMACVMHFVDLRDENVFGLDEAYTWSQAVTDFRSYLLEEAIPVLNPEQL